MSHSKVLGLGLQLINRGGGAGRWYTIQPVTEQRETPLFRRGTIANYPLTALATCGPHWATIRLPNVEDICLQSPSQLRVDRKSDVRLVWKCFHSALQQEFLAIVEHQEQRNRIRKPNACGIGLSGESPLLPFQGRLQPAPNLVFPQLLGPPPTA